MSASDERTERATTIALASSNLHERVSALEAGLTGIRHDVHDLKYSVEKLTDSLGKSGKTDWPVVWSGAAVVLMLVFSLWASAIEPLKDKVAEHKAELNHFGEVNYQSMQRLQDDKERFIRVENDQNAMEREMDGWRRNDMPSIRERLAVMQWRLDHPSNEP